MSQVLILDTSAVSSVLSRTTSPLSSSNQDPLTCPIVPGKETTIEINKGKHGLGVSIVGGSDSLLVSRMFLPFCDVTNINDNIFCDITLRVTFNSSSGRVVRVCASGAVDCLDSESGQTDWNSQLPCLTLSIKWTVWRTSRQVYMLCRWERHLTVGKATIL